MIAKNRSLLALAYMLPFVASVKGAEKKSNVLFIMTDDLRRDSLSFYGGPVETPHLDKLASESVAFNQAYCVYPMCTPSRASFLTGRFPHALTDVNDRTYFFNDWLLDTNEVTVAKSLSSAGYRCAYIGKWHNDKGNAGTHIPRGRRRLGFNDFWAGVNARSHRTHPFYFNDNGEKIEVGEKWEADLEADLTVDYLKKAAAEENGKPFFLVCSLNPPHGPLDLSVNRKYLLEEAEKQFSGLRPNVPPQVEDEAKDLWIKYHANVLGVDDVVGRLMRTLDKLDLSKNTLVVFTADHGESLFSHGLQGKNQFYEEATAIPLFFRAPSGQMLSGKLTSEFANMTDIAPTVLEFCGIPVPERMQGKSLLPLLTGRTDSGPHTSTYLEINHPWWDYRFGQGPQGNRRCLITKEWKLVLMESKLGCGGAIPWQLFDRKNDPYEMTNLAQEPGYQWLICKLVHEMWDWMDATNDPFYDITLNGFREIKLK